VVLLHPISLPSLACVQQQEVQVIVPGLPPREREQAEQFETRHGAPPQAAAQGRSAPVLHEAPALVLELPGEVRVEAVRLPGEAQEGAAAVAAAATGQTSRWTWRPPH